MAAATAYPVFDRRRVGARFRRERRRRGVSMEALSARSGVSLTTITHFERGLTLVRLDTFCLLCWGLGVSADRMLGAPDPAGAERVLPSPGEE